MYPIKYPKKREEITAAIMQASREVISHQRSTCPQSRSTFHVKLPSNYFRSWSHRISRNLAFI